MDEEDLERRLMLLSFTKRDVPSELREKTCRLDQGIEGKGLPTNAFKKKKGGVARGGSASRLYEEKLTVLQNQKREDFQEGMKVARYRMQRTLSWFQKRGPKTALTGNANSVDKEKEGGKKRQNLVWCLLQSRVQSYQSHKTTKEGGEKCLLYCTEKRKEKKKRGLQIKSEREGRKKDLAFPKISEGKRTERAWKKESQEKEENSVATLNLFS